MVHIEDRNLEPASPKVYGYCEFCNEPIYIGDVIYSNSDFEVCEDCKEDFLREFRRVAE